MKSMTWLALLLAFGSWGTPAGAQTKEVTIAHQDMIVPFRVAQAAGAVERSTGYKINWKIFGGGGDVIKAMASGDVPIGEVGSSPATAAIAQGLDIEVVWVLDDINNAEQLVVTPNSGITDLAGLKGKKIATPLASTAHYQLIYALSKADIKPGEVQVINLRPQEIAAAWERGDIDGTFVWDPVLSRVKANGGKVILSSADVAKLGAPTFDAVIVNKAWADKNKPFVTALVKELARADAAYRQDKTRYAADSVVVKTIARVVGAKAEDVPATLDSYAFPPAAVQASAVWLGGGKESGVAKALANTAHFLKEQGRIVEVPADFSKYVNAEYAAAAAR
ncbi:taurine transport system substrate-binding protein [Rhodopseudomonas rhenobacensis]|uniref:Taurine transport system substrate-binding protein n=1 Tax=Rhodopseudomonas rhenobacensis TaxID=87461 RepID=A0A7W7Z2S8_9BRAD|nr:taurine ABC transporter substrate-binding protein [Rhodopseudomonas rhenobacensis]MBB5046914.1 taurine transport system substrate-binding protein [Rhodopseudomonas rhenobacensis]